MITPAGNTNHFGFFVEADYMFKPWIMGFVRYEQVKIFNPAWSHSARTDIGRRTGAGRAGSHVRDPPEPAPVERSVHRRAGRQPRPRDIPESTDQWITSLQYAF